MKEEKKDFNLLGKSVDATPTSPAESPLDTFPNQFNRDFLIQFDCIDFTSLCPITGQPDFAKIKIKYIPAKLCVETKSLKYYLQSYRNFQGFNEKVVNSILNDLVEAANPKWMRVEGEFAARGGIYLTTVAEHPELDLDSLKNR